MKPRFSVAFLFDYYHFSKQMYKCKHRTESGGSGLSKIKAVYDFSEFKKFQNYLM